MTESNRPVLSLHNGDATNNRLVVVFANLRHSRIMGSYAERVFGPWQSPEQTRRELGQVHAAQETGDVFALDWLTGKGAEVVCAFIDTDVERRQ